MSGPGFGTARNADSFLPLSSMLDFYNGGGIDVAFLGMAEVDCHGNVNVSRFGPRMPGCGGFIDISQNAKKVVFVGTFTAGGLKVAVRDGKLKVEQEGQQRKFRSRVQEVTFAAASAGDREVLYVTERAVFRLDPHGGGLVLTEIAPGADLQRDVLAHMEFAPKLGSSSSGDVAGSVGGGEQRVMEMDARVFRIDELEEAAAAALQQPR